MDYLNLGCGSHFHKDWTNVDLVSNRDCVIACNLVEGIPFSDRSFDVVYHSHVLEHLPRPVAESFLQECYRVLRSEGVLRIAIPDLEQIVRTYLVALEQAVNGSPEWSANYDWIVLEMYDQTVRTSCGGEMAAYLFQDKILNQDFVLKRLGVEAEKLIEAGKKRRQNSQSLGLGDRSFKTVLKQIYWCFRYSKYRREILLKILLGKEYNTLEVGRFRQTGEVHQWMYDRYSLTRLLQKCGFKNILQRTASESYVTNWADFNLDTNSQGEVYRPDSLFMEAMKPTA